MRRLPISARFHRARNARRRSSHSRRRIRPIFVEALAIALLALAVFHRMHAHALVLLLVVAILFATRFLGAWTQERSRRFQAKLARDYARAISHH